MSIIISEDEDEFDSYCLVTNSTNFSQSGRPTLLKRNGFRRVAFMGRRWKLIWRLNLQERIKFFMWELGHSWLLSNESRWKRGLALGADCERCLCQVESCVHIVRDCRESAEVSLHLLPQIFPTNSSPSLFVTAWIEIYWAWNPKRATGVGQRE